MAANPILNKHADSTPVNVELIACRSVRDPEGGDSLALLTCSCFDSSETVFKQTWRLDISSNRVLAVCEDRQEGLSFAVADFAADPMLSRFTN